MATRYTVAVPTFTTAQLRRSCWIAIFAMLALALLPSVSHALAAARGAAGLAEVCTPLGARLVARDDAGRDDAPVQVSGALEHCPYCGLSTPSLGMPPAGLPKLAVAATAAHSPRRLAQRPVELLAWRSGLPRAPPRLV